MTDDNSLYSDPKQPDEFRTESPLRAFAEYSEYQGWMIAKGFRPSMQHLVRYLAAMERREGYRLVQILEAATGVPTMIFRTTARAPLDVVSDVFKSSELARDWVKNAPTEVTSESPVDVLETMAEGIADELGIEVDRDSFQVAREHLEEMVPVKFDDANPAHYNGWECGDIGERLSANGYQILKYCWRLGKKDDPCKELTKALRYLDREVDYINTVFPGHTLVPNFGGIAPSNRLNYMLDRTANQSQFTADVALFLWNGYTAEMLDELKAMIVDHRFHLDCGNGLAV